jgi:hypothetical protein
MATVATNVLMSGLSGRFGDSLIFRMMRGKTYVSPPARKPDKLKQSQAQRNTRVKFSKAAQWAQATLLEPKKKTYYKQRAKALRLPNAYTAAIADYMRKLKVVKTQHQNTLTYQIDKPGFALKRVLVVNNEDSRVTSSSIVVRQHKHQWLVHYMPNGSLAPITLTIFDNTGQEIQATFGEIDSHNETILFKERGA